MKRIAWFVLFCAACKAPAPAPVAVVAENTAVGTVQPAVLAEVGPDVKAELAKLAGVAVESLKPLESEDEEGQMVPLGGVVAQVDSPTAATLIVAERDRFADRGYLLFRAEMRFGFDGELDDIALLATRDQFDILRVMGT